MNGRSSPPASELGPRTDRVAGVNAAPRAFFWLMAWLLALTPLGAAAQSTLPAAIARALAQAAIPENAAGFYVHEIGAAEPLVAAGAERAAESRLHHQARHDLRRRSSCSARPSRGRRKSTRRDRSTRTCSTGDLVLKGYGDPKLTLENFWLLLRELRARGLREIRGDLVLDRSYFSGVESDPGAFRRPADPALQHRCRMRCS